MKSKKVEKQVRKHYSPEFKKEALLRAERDGAAVAAKDLGLNVSQLYSWRTKDRASGQVSEEQRLAQSENARLKRELARLEEENAFQKKVLREDPEMRYAMIRTHEGKFSIRLMCRVLQVSPSGYYDWRCRGSSATTQARAALDEQVKEAFLAEKCRAGAPRLTRRLKARGHGAGRNQIAESLRRQGLRAVRRVSSRRRPTLTIAYPLRPICCSKISMLSDRTRNG